MDEGRREDDRRLYTLSRERPAVAVVKMGVPLICGMLIMVAYNLTDTYFVSLSHDDYQLAAVNLAYPLMMVMVALANIIGTGASSLIARCLGAKDQDLATSTLTCAFSLICILGITVAIAGLLLATPIVTVLGARENTFAHTAAYVRILVAGALPTMGSYTIGALLRAEGSVRQSVLGMISGTLANIALDPLLIFTCGLGVAGAAAATVLGNAFGLAVSLSFYVRGKTLLRPERRYVVPQLPVVREILAIGLPASLETLLTSAAFVVNNQLAVGYGELTVAAMGIAQKIMSVGSYIYQGFASGTQPIMGYAFGARDFDRMRATLKAAILVTSGTELCVMAVLGIFAPEFVAIFSSSPEVIATGAKVLRTIVFILPFVGATSISRMSFQASGKPLAALLITFVRQALLYVPLLLALNHLFGFNGMIWAQPVTEAIMMVVSVCMLLHMIEGERARQTA